MRTSDIKEILITKEDLAKRIKELGKEITKDYKDSKNLLLIGILKGSVVFLADLMREIDLHTQIDFMTVSSYGSGAKTTGSITIKKDLDTDIEGCDVIIVEDIIDSGVTLHNLKNLLLERNPKSLKICALLDKKERREIDVTVDYAGFDIPNEFIVGYGLDYADNYRNLDYIGVLKREVYE